MLNFKHRITVWIVALMVPLTSYGAIAVQHIHTVDDSSRTHNHHSDGHTHSHSHQHSSENDDQSSLSNGATHSHIYLWGFELGLPVEETTESDSGTDWAVPSQVKFRSQSVESVDSSSRPTNALIAKIQLEYVTASWIDDQVEPFAAQPLRADFNHGASSFVVCHDSPGVLLI